MKKSIKKRKVGVVLVFILTFLAVAQISGLRNENCDNLYLITSASLNPPSSQLAETLKFGYTNCKGEIVVKPEYDEGEDFNEGVGVLRRGSDSYLVYLSGRIKKLTGVLVRRPYSEGLTIGRKGKSFFIIDKDGNLKSKLSTRIKKGKQIEYYDVDTFSDGLAAVSTDDGIGFVDKSGKLVIEPKFDYTNGFYDGMAAVSIDEKSALINTRGEYIIPPIEDENIGILDASDGLAQMYKTLPDNNNLIRFYDKKGALILSVQNFDYVGRFTEGLAAINIGDKWGFINHKGEIVIKPQFDQVHEFSEGFAAVRINNKWGFINREGRFTIEPRFSWIGEGFNLGLKMGFKKGVAFVKDGDLIGYINFKGEWLWNRCEYNCVNLQKDGGSVNSSSNK